MAEPDFNYRRGELFTLVMPNNPDAESAWVETIAPLTNGSGNLLTVQLPRLLRDLRAAGYSVRASQPIRSDADLLAGLEL